MRAEPSRLPPHLRSFGVGALAVLALSCASPSTRAEPFIGQFELKTLDSEPGSFEFQSQNAWSRRQPSRRIIEGPDGYELDGNSVVQARYALELEAGITRRLKTRFGVEFEKERLDDPATIDQANDFDDLSLTEVGAELIAVLVPRPADGLGYGIVAELEGPIDQDEPNNFTLGFIAEYQSGRWFAAAIPMFVRAFGGDAEDGEQIDDKWDFAYALQVTRRLSERWALALEGYGTVERLGNSGHPSEAARLFGDFNQHRAGPVFYYTYDFGGRRGREPRGSESGLLTDTDTEAESTQLTIGFGLLYGLNDNTPDHTIKLSIEVDF